MTILGGMIGATRPSSQAGSNTETIVEIIPSSVRLVFTESNGVDFTLHHGLDSEDLIMQMFHQGEQVLPKSMKPYGPDDIQITLDVPMNGTLLLIAI